MFRYHNFDLHLYNVDKEHNFALLNHITSLNRHLPTLPAVPALITTLVSETCSSSSSLSREEAATLGDDGCCSA
jgi:hypothetical protein